MSVESLKEEILKATITGHGVEHDNHFLLDGYGHPVMSMNTAAERISVALEDEGLQHNSFAL